MEQQADREASWDAFGLWGWTGWPWIWKKEPQWRQEWNQSVQDTVAATDTCVAMEGGVEKNAEGSSVTAPSLRMMDHSARMVSVGKDGTFELYEDVSGIWHCKEKIRQFSVISWNRIVSVPKPPFHLAGGMILFLWRPLTASVRSDVIPSGFLRGSSMQHFEESNNLLTICLHWTFTFL